MWSIWSIHHQIWTHFATVDEIWNSVEEIWIWPSYQNWYFTLFITLKFACLLFETILKVVWKWGDGNFWNFEQFRDLTWGVPWKRACRTMVLHWGRVSRYTAGVAAAIVHPDTRPIHICYIYYRHQAHRPKIYSLNILVWKPRGLFSLTFGFMPLLLSQCYPPRSL